ncbi:MAG: class I SAM-dependent methyltransferase [Fervidicoccaceae archaeon]
MDELEPDKANKDDECSSFNRSSFLIIGDIGIINIGNDEELAKAREFAECFSKKNPNLKGFFAKLSTEGEFRVARLVHLLGENRTNTITKEYGLFFYVDIAKAYYNPRLSEEHRKIALSVEDGEKVLDLFSGIGGFSIHIAHLHRSLVFSNDWNREAIFLLLKSVFLNRKRLKGSIYATSVESGLLIDRLKGKMVFDRVIMNSPTNSFNYLGKAIEILKTGGFVHLYILLPKGIEEITHILPSTFLSMAKIVNIEEVLEYSPSKSIYRIDIIKLSDQ